jgi:hypothetical protein
MDASVSVDDLDHNFDGFFFFQFAMGGELVSECALGAKLSDDVHAIFCL